MKQIIYFCAGAAATAATFLAVPHSLIVQSSEGGFYMAVNWSKDVDQVLAEAKKDERPILLDFSAAPA